MEQKRKKVCVGVSGGVDSSVALALLKEEGYDVTGVFLKVWHPDFLSCDWREERRSAMRVCATLGVPFITLDCEAEYKKEVADYMINEYRAGRTPNPDIFCNKYVKFGVFLNKAREMGADYIATGHYARIDEGIMNNELGIINYKLHESVDQNKDQSYFLYTLNQEQLAHTLFPIGGMTKPEVRLLAKKYGLPTATKKDSQGVCFLGKLDMKEFLSYYVDSKRGDVLDTSGEVVGYHDGAIFYTIGQRHGFTITKKGSDDPRFFVVSKDIDRNTITVADKESKNDVVYSIKEVVIKDLHIIQGMPLGSKGIPWNKITCTVRIRYRQEKQICKVEKKDDGWHVIFDLPQNGVAVGQSAVLYRDTECLGGGIIEITI